MKKYTTLPLTLIVVFLMFASTAFSQDLLYRPTNPAFGGSPLNYSWMLNSAQVQDTTEDPKEAAGSSFNQDPLTRFTESLNRQLLSQISRDILNSQFGEGGLTEGSYQIGDFLVDILPSFDGLTITIFDVSSGGETTITIPYF